MGLHLGYGLRRKLVAGEWARSHFLLGVPKGVCCSWMLHLSRVHSRLSFMFGARLGKAFGTLGEALPRCLLLESYHTHQSGWLGFGSVRFGLFWGHQVAG